MRSDLRCLAVLAAERRRFGVARVRLVPGRAGLALGALGSRLGAARRGGRRRLGSGCTLAAGSALANAQRLADLAQDLVQHALGHVTQRHVSPPENNSMVEKSLRRAGLQRQRVQHAAHIALQRLVDHLVLLHAALAAEGSRDTTSAA